MSFSVSVWWDASRLCYRARVRGGGKDIKRRVPPAVFRAMSLDPAKPSAFAERLALQWAHGNAPELWAGQERQGRGLSLRGLWELYLLQNPGDARPLTLLRNAQYLAHLDRILGHLPPSRINTLDATHYRNKRTFEGASPRTIGGELFFLRHLLAWGYECRRDTGMSELNLMRVPKVRLEAGHQKGLALTAEEIAAIRAFKFARGGEHFHRIFLFGIASMIRLRPLLALRHEWIEDGWLRIPAAMMKGRAPHELHVPLAKIALAQLGEGQGAVWGEGRTRWLHRCVQQLVRKGVCRRFSAHDLRRTGITILREGGVPIEVIRRLAGHSTRSVTEDYIRRWGAPMQEAIGVMDRALGGGNIVPKKPRKGA